MVIDRAGIGEHHRMIYKVKCVHSGQYRSYGSSYYEFLISASKDEDTITLIEECLSNKEIRKYPVNPDATIVSKGDRLWNDDMSVYFRGFCWIEDLNEGDYDYKFTYYHPNDD